ncbi:MAG: FAD-dependent oxidoreductase, partial [Pseudomonadota bacterium]
MTELVETDLCVIGGGSGGLAVAAGASQMGARVVLIEKGKMGGDCLNYGCVPSKSLIAAAHTAHNVRHGGHFGVNGQEPQVDFLKVHDHIYGVIGTIAPHDSVERFEGLGVRVIQAAARFTGPREIEADDIKIRAKRFVIATGSSPAVPPILGINDVPYLTTETIFDLTERPEHLIVIGSGPIGTELAQAHRRLGAKVTILGRGRLLPKDDPDAVDVVRQRLRADGVVLHEGATIDSVMKRGNGVAVQVKYRDGEQESVQ